jgi:hypothetical protein
MEKQGHFQTMVRFLGTVAFVDVGILVAVILVCWLLGWRTASQYGNATFFAGIAVIALGVTSIAGGYGTTRSAIYKYGQSVGADTLDQSTRQDMKEIVRSYDFLYLMGAVGLVLVVVGALIQTVFR